LELQGPPEKSVGKITGDAETAKAAERDFLKYSLQAPRSNVAFVHKL
jgi:hypothetical protein